ncbi:hypothetical protein D3C81_1160970 [compost metagenome]
MHAGIGHAVEQVRRGEVLAEGELRLQRGDVALGVTADRIVVAGARTRAAAAVVAAVVAQAPVTQVHPGIETDVVLAGVLAACVAAQSVAVVVDERCRDAAIPVARVDVTTRGTAEVSLGNAHVQAQGGQVQIGTCSRHLFGDADAVGVRCLGNVWQALDIQAQAGQLAAFEAVAHRLLVLGFLHPNILASDPALVDIHIQPIAARCHRIAPFEAGNIDIAPIRPLQKVWVERSLQCIGLSHFCAQARANRSGQQQTPGMRQPAS